MSALSLPILPGQGWSVHKKPTFATLVAPHVSGREVRAPLYANPIWAFEATYDGLDSSAANYPGLGGGSLQTLMGLFLQCQGQLGTFLYFDPTDYQVSARSFGLGNGTATAFQLSRALGGFVEPVLAPFAPTALALSPVSNASFAPNNLLANSVGANAGMTGANATITGAQTDPAGGALAILASETTANASHGVTHATIPISPSGVLTWSVYLKAGSASLQQLALSNTGSSQPAQTLYANFNLSSGVIAQTGAIGTGAVLSSAQISPAAGGYYRCSLSGRLDGVSATARAEIWGLNGSPAAGYAPVYVGAASNNVTAAFPQLEQTLAAGPPGAFNPTLATPYFGGPLVTAAGALIDPSAYSLSNGLVIFATPPASGAALLWSGYFAFLCRFDADDLDFEQFMANLWRVDSLKFRSVRPQ